MTDERPTEHGGPAGPTGLLIIRAWTEVGSSGPLRAHIRLSNDIAGGIERTFTLSRVDAVCDTVREWLTEILNDSDRPDE